MTLTHEKLLQIIDETLAWASDVSEKWAGTLYEKLIDTQQAQLVKAIEQGDDEKAYDILLELAQLLNYAEESYELETT